MEEQPTEERKAPVHSGTFLEEYGRNDRLGAAPWDGGGAGPMGASVSGVGGRREQGLPGSAESITAMPPSLPTLEKERGTLRG